MGSIPPILPAIVHLPIAFVVLSVAADLIGSWTRSASLRATGFWSLMAGAITALLAVAAGYYDMNRATLSAETDGLVHLHVRTGWAVLVAVTLLAAWRLWAWHRDRRAASPRRAGPAYTLMALLVLSLVAFQGWYGGEMVYAYGTSVAATGQGVEPAGEAKRRLWAVYQALGAPAGMGHSMADMPGRVQTEQDQPLNGRTAPATEAMSDHSDHVGTTTTSEALPTGRAR